MPFVFSNSVIRLFKASNIDVEKVRASIDSAIAESTRYSTAERTETVKVSGAKTVTASVTLKDVTKATKIEASRPLRFAYLSQTLSTLEKVDCAPRTIALDGALAMWLGQFVKAPEPEQTPEPEPATVE